MTIADLKEKIKDLPDDMNVLVPMNPSEKFDGMFFSPCVGASGVIDMAPPGMTMEEAERLENLKQPLPTVPEFMLVPCGYMDRACEEEKEGPAELN